jgi:hypothetical protein
MIFPTSGQSQEYLCLNEDDLNLIKKYKPQLDEATKKYKPKTGVNY